MTNKTPSEKDLWEMILTVATAAIHVAINWIFKEESNSDDE